MGSHRNFLAVVIQVKILLICKYKLLACLLKATRITNKGCKREKQPNEVCIRQIALLISLVLFLSQLYLVHGNCIAGNILYIII